MSKSKSNTLPEKEKCPCPSKDSSTDSTSQCPVNHINYANMMEFPDVRVGSEQTRPLPCHRVPSSIPKGAFTPSHQQEDSEVWLYPSEQQYYNAMKRKGWNPKESDMSSVVAIHNVVNEKGWKEVLKWEGFHSSSYNSTTPKLQRFMGRPQDISPKARFLHLLGYELPFDRHDWIVDRNGTDVRYIIDFYSGKAEPGKAISIYLDVRPALDSFGNLFDRVRMQFHERVAPFLPFGELFSSSSVSSYTSVNNEKEPTS